MICSKCGTQNSDLSPRCVVCGSVLQSNIQSQPLQPGSNMVTPPERQDMTVNSNVIPQPNTVPDTPINIEKQEDMMYKQNYYESATPNTVAVTSWGIADMIKFIIAMLIKPITVWREEKQQFNDVKQSFLLGGIICIIGTICSFAQSLYQAVAIKQLDWGTGKTVTEWHFDNLKELNYIDLIGKTVLLYIGIILAIAILYYIVSLILKKETKFGQVLAASSAAVVPLFCGMLVLLPLLSWIYMPLGMFVAFLSCVYALVMLCQLMNEVLDLSEDISIYVNVICLTILGASGYYLLTQYLVSAISSGVSDILGMLG